MPLLLLALITPTVMVWVRPNGFPIAITHSPVLIRSESPKESVGRLLALILSNATSDKGSAPIFSAGKVLPSRSFTVIF